MSVIWYWKEKRVFIFQETYFNIIAFVNDIYSRENKCYRDIEIYAKWYKNFARISQSTNVLKPTDW